MICSADQGKNRDGKDIRLPFLRQVLHRCADDLIDDEQVQRILSPVLHAINKGEYDLLRSPFMHEEVSIILCLKY